ncbi:MAG: HNH endonuclease [Clostridia bacterium]|nr:HNH endonuclease [Clostridia bacterium]
MAKDYARSFYDSSTWKKTQALYLSSQNYICEDCGGVACIVHHIKHITPDNINDPDITLNWDNLKAVCTECHAIEHMGKDARLNGISFDEEGNVIKQPNVYLICGSPASGKTAYVNRNKTNRDLVIDLDLICAALMGEENNNYLNNEPILSVAIEVRTLLYSIVKTRRGNWDKAYIISTISNILEQKALANELNAEIVIINTPLEECIRRLHKDQQRAGKIKMLEELISKWHENYNKSLEFSKHPPYSITD